MQLEVRLSTFERAYDVDEGGESEGEGEGRPDHPQPRDEDSE